MKSPLCVYLAAFSLSFFSPCGRSAPSGDDLADSNESSVPAAGEHDQTLYGSYLGCLNRLSPPIARGMNVNPDRWDAKGPWPEPERSPNLFYSDKQKGFFYVYPDTATFDVVPLYKPPGPWDPMYTMTVRRSDGGETVVNYFVSEGHGNSASETGNPEENNKTKAGNPEAVYVQIGQPKSRIKEPELALKAMTAEILPRLGSLKENLDSEKRRWPQSRSKVPNSWASHLDSMRRETLCACAKVNRPEILEAVKRAAKDLGIPEEEINKCIDNLVSSWKAPKLPHLNVNLLPVAAAAPQASKLTVDLIIKNRNSQISNLDLKTEQVSFCSKSRRLTFNTANGRGQTAGCPQNDERAHSLRTCASDIFRKAELPAEIRECLTKGNTVVWSDANSSFYVKRIGASPAR